ncbi:MAG: (d)CMP kinase [Gammaproteobacteria bacterium]|nr:(d)CMP kinase [Gammaproteobacteria bacterium]MCH9763384.1 (d)CMP kinase [Gammaproteobacteria bacterium]
MSAYKNTVPVITLDGPSGTGKGTLCHRLADYLGWHLLDSGVLYRALGFLTEKHHVALDSEAQLDQLVQLAMHLPIEFNQQHIVLEGEQVGGALRTEACGARASKLAAIPEVRAALLQRQRDFAVSPGLVTDGRDMGTVVFPDAALKIYLDASIHERASRRYLQLKDAGKNVNLAQVFEELAKRDTRDMARKHAPLKAADEAITVDTTDLTVDDVFEYLLKLVKQQGFMGKHG